MMKGTKSLILPLFLLLIISAGPAEDFEGTFTMDIQTYDEKQQLDGPLNINATYHVKDNFMLMEMKLPEAPVPSKVLMDLEEELVYALVEMQGRKMGMKMTIPNKEALSEKSNSSNGDIKYQMTSETLEILGYTCKQVIIETDKMSGELYVTKELEIGFSKFFSGMNAYSKNKMSKGINMTPELHKFLQGGFPMKVHMEDKDSENWYKMEITSIERKKLPESMFDISGYQIMDMNQLQQDR